MIDVCIPTVDGRWLILPRYTQPDTDTKILLHKLRMNLPTQPPPRMTTNPDASAPALAPTHMLATSISPANTIPRKLNDISGFKEPAIVIHVLQWIRLELNVQTLGDIV